MPGGKQRRPGFLLAILLQGKRERKTSQPPRPVRVELTAPDAALRTWGPAEAARHPAAPTCSGSGSTALPVPDTSRPHQEMPPLLSVAAAGSS